MKKRLALMTTLLILAGDMALARVTPEALASEWTAMGYGTIEITQGRTQTKIEAIRGGQKVEVIYDTASGRVLKREEEQAEAGDDIRPGIWVRSRSRDFVRVVAGGSGSGWSGDDDGPDDGDDDHGGHGSDDDDDGDDDHGGHGSDDDDDGDDDHGGHGSDDDDDDDDDHGGGHHGNDDDDDHGSGQGRGRGRGRGGD